MQTAKDDTRAKGEVLEEVIEKFMLEIDKGQFPFIVLQYEGFHSDRGYDFAATANILEWLWQYDDLAEFVEEDNFIRMVTGFRTFNLDQFVKAKNEYLELLKRLYNDSNQISPLGVIIIIISYEKGKRGTSLTFNQYIAALRKLNDVSSCFESDLHTRCFYQALVDALTASKEVSKDFEATMIKGSDSKIELEEATLNALLGNTIAMIETYIKDHDPAYVPVTDSSS